MIKTPSRRGKVAGPRAEKVDPAIVKERMSMQKTYSGIAVAAFKTGNLLQLVSPFAPEGYGSSEPNVLRDLKTGRTSG